MYIRKSGQIKFLDDSFLPFGGKLNKNNRWIKLAELIPWDEFEGNYVKHFKSSTRGEEALSVRHADYPSKDEACRRGNTTDDHGKLLSSVLPWLWFLRRHTPSL